MIKRRNYKVIALTLTFLMLFASVASAAIPTDSVIIGDKAYSIGYVTNPANAAEIQAALDNLGTGQLAYNIDGQTSGWTSIMGGTPLTADQIAALPPITYKNDAGEVSNYAAGDGDLIPIGTSLSVSSVSVVNRSAIEVTFDKAVDAVAVANFSLSKGTVKTVGLNTAKTVATLGVEGLDYEDVVTVTVSNVTAGDATLTSYSKEITIPAFGEFYKVQVTAEDDVILADGLSKTMVTAKIIDKVANKPVIVDGLVTFTTTKGDFAQPQVSFDQNGVAALQLTSEVSTSVITAFITATVTNVPGATEYEGLVGQYQVRFAPAEEMEDQLKMVSIVAVNASQADRINVVFSDDVSAADIIAQYPTFALAQADNFGFDIDTFGKSSLDVIITNIEQVNAKTIRLILDTDNKFVNGVAGTTELRYDYLTSTGTAYDVEANAIIVAGGFNGAYLRDNMTHNVSVPLNVGKKVVANAVGLNFVLTDISKPWIAGVDVINQMTLDVRFSEAMAEDLVEKIETVGGNDLYKNFRIDGKRLMKIAGASSTALERTAAINNNYILVKALYVNPYWVAGEAKDNRNIVTIEIDPWNKLAAGTYSIQASNVGDWAAMSHSANMLETQTFDFTVEADTQVPTATLQVQSPEQWLITFDRPVKIADAKQLKDALKIYTKEEYAKATPTALTMTDAFAPVKHYQVTAIDKDGLRVLGAADGIDPTDTNATVNGVERLLIEFKQDWTVEYDTVNSKINYFHSTKSPYIVVLNHWIHDVTENPMAEKVFSAATPLDAVSPTIADAKDLYELSPNKLFRTLMATNNGQYVFVEMSEPVQLRNAPNTANSTPLTESQQQAAGAGIPVPTFEFVKGDAVIPGSLVAASIPQDDFDFVVQPDNPLTAGTWTLIIRSISDDVGNTSATVTRDFVVEEAVGAETDTRISWIGFDNGPTAHDYIFIKFTKEMKSTDANGVSRTTNYSLNNNPLPTGSEIIKGIKDLEGNAGIVAGAVYANVTNNWDGVTIKLPKGAWDGTSVPGGTNFTCVVGVASNFIAADGEALTGPYTVELTHRVDNSFADADFDFEALYENNILKVTNLIAGRAVVKAEAYDTDANGKIETISLYDYTGAKIAGLAGHEILVNGVAFTSDGTDYVSATGVNTTAANGLKITSTIGAIIVNTGNVLDLAKPVVIKALGAAGSKLVTVTFSEAVIGSDIAPNAGDILPADLAYTNVSGAGAASIASVGTHTAPVTSVVVTLDADLVAGDIGVDTIGAAATIKDLAPTPNTGAATTATISN
ncbi:Ig-like domain-containing protein [Syntrophomonas wolfei]|uniref:Ig-like domain-containing protein n=1 Tax=Syntrophomonas wolfei TaxID=863 RepID=UPI0023F1F516|nr:Ig-like domain-containing protein [Syntrophomonas wolfei]